jgi:peptidoglycan/xylan/chitin deacetylase (PgdA/CDA1 family)
MVGRILTTSLHALGVVLYLIGVGDLVRRIGRKNPKILLYHDCAPEETAYTAGLECTTPPMRFKAHLDYLRRYYTFVDVDTIVSGKAPDHAVAITFDDGYASVYDHAFPLLRNDRIPATVYLISSVVGNATLVWVNELNALLRRGKSEAVECVRRHFAISGKETPERIITFCRRNYDATKMQALLEDLRAALALPVSEHAAATKLYLSWDQVHEMNRAGIAFGNHSRTHPNMECLTEEEQLAEIESAQSELEQHLVVTGFAHPFGHKGPTTAQLAADVGLKAAVDVGGYNRPVVPLSLGRTHLSNESVAGLFARMEVVEPIKELLRRRILRSARLAEA